MQKWDTYIPITNNREEFLACKFSYLHAYWWIGLSRTSVRLCHWFGTEILLQQYTYLILWAHSGHLKKYVYPTNNFRLDPFIKASSLAQQESESQAYGNSLACILLLLQKNENEKEGS